MPKTLVFGTTSYRGSGKPILPRVMPFFDAQAVDGGSAHCTAGERLTRGHASTLDANVLRRHNAVVEDSMKTITIRNVPEDLYLDLRRLAERNRRSLQQQALVLFERARLSRLGSPAKRAAEIRSRLAERALGDTVTEIRHERER